MTGVTDQSHYGGVAVSEIGVFEAKDHLPKLLQDLIKESVILHTG